MRSKFAGARSNYDGKSGDSSGKEICIHKYYNFNKEFGQSYILRISDVTTRHRLPVYAKAICKNDLIGYSQQDRYSLIENLKKTVKIGDIKTKCNCDCSSMIGAIMYRMGFKSFNYWTSTRTMKSDFEKCMKQYGIKYRIIKFSGDQNDLRKGDILLNEQRHVVVVM